MSPSASDLMASLTLEIGVPSTMYAGQFDFHNADGERLVGATVWTVAHALAGLYAGKYSSEWVRSLIADNFSAESAEMYDSSDVLADLVEFAVNFKPTPVVRPFRRDEYRYGGSC